MFEDLKPLVFLVAMSLMLVGATIAVAIPNTVEAVAARWCNNSNCFSGKGQCEKANDGECNRTKLYTP